MARNTTGQELDLDRVKRIAWRRLPLLLIPLTLIMPVVIVAVHELPLEYEASSTLLVTEPKIENPLEDSMPRRIDPNQRRISMEQKMLSTTNLNGVVQGLGLDREVLRDTPVQTMFTRFKHRIPSFMPEPIDDARLQEMLVHKLKRRVTLTLEGNRLIKVSYRGVNSSLNARIVNTIVRGFVETSLSSDRDARQDEVTFLRKRKDEYKRRLETSEQELQEFKKKHLIEMPADVEASTSTLRRDKESLLDTEILLSQLTAQLANIDKQISSQKENITSESSTVDNPRTIDLRRQISDMELELIRMKATLTDKNPRVIQQAEMVAKLKEELEQSQTEMVTSETVVPNPVIQELRIQRSEVESNAEAATTRINMLKERVAAAEQLIKSVPAQEQELAKLQREYDSNSDTYRQLADKLASAEMKKSIAQDMSQAETYEIVEVAEASTIPAGSERIRLTLMGIMAGLGLGIAIVAALEFFDQSFHDADNASKFLNLPLLSTVPTIMTKSEMRIRSTRRVLLLAVLCMTLGCELMAALIVSGLF